MIDRNEARAYYLTTAIVAILVVIAAVWGVINSGMYKPFAGEQFVPVALGQDIVSILAAFVLLGFMNGVRHGSRPAGPAWIAVLGYVLFAYGQYAIDGVYDPLFPLYIVIAGVTVFTIIGLYVLLDKDGFRAIELYGALPVAIAVLLILVPACLVPLWAYGVIGGITASVRPVGHATFVLDLIFVLPLSIIAAVRVIGKRSGGEMLAGILLIIYTIVGLAVTLGELLRLAFGQPLQLLTLIIFAALTVLGGILVLMYYPRARSGNGISASRATV
ncbi:MAG TPA: hypothetical protein VMW87_10940 [Spirochaetia bacterium]|nr:hypothetical protein [Spirochaetia bacterium]